MIDLSLWVGPAGEQRVRKLTSLTKSCHQPRTGSTELCSASSLVVPISHGLGGGGNTAIASDNKVLLTFVT